MNVRRLRLTVVRCLGDMRLARDRVPTLWDECTYEALPLRRLDKQSRIALADASRALKTAVWMPPAKRRQSIPDALAAVRYAWQESCRALEGWDVTRHSLSTGESALEALQEACERLAR